MELKQIAEEARDAKACAVFLKRMGTADLAQLCAMFFAGSDWAMEHGFPRLETLRAFRGQTEPHGIYTDFKGIADTPKAAFFGSSDAEILAEGFEVREVYARHNSRLKITAKGSAYVVANVLDDATLDVVCEGDARVAVYCYGRLENITAVGNGFCFKVCI